ncbi:alpha/beta hydrolase [Pelosinus sp. sgz500959]|uniref:alpha/beta hydrolase n=1 Tax=Pelosinus sp. sgz500959 TaxID=3242472 RepID=UPI00366D921D
MLIGKPKAKTYLIDMILAFSVYEKKDILALNRDFLGFVRREEKAMEQQIIIHTDSHQLSGVLHIPKCTKEEKKPAVVICHGFISSKVGQHRIFVKTARQLCQAGFVVLRFDFSGCGESSGEYRDVTITQQIQEASKAIDRLLEHPNVNCKQITLVGHSLGGAIAASVASVDDRIHRLILLSPVANPFDDITQIVGPELYEKCLKESVINYEGFEIGRELFLSLPTIRPLEAIHQFQGDVLLIHGSDDKDTPLENAYQYKRILEKRSQGHCNLYVIKGADHTYNSPLWEKELQTMILQWLA